jgi:hypothetical protein
VLADSGPLARHNHPHALGSADSALRGKRGWHGADVRGSSFPADEANGGPTMMTPLRLLAGGQANRSSGVRTITATDSKLRGERPELKLRT